MKNLNILLVLMVMFLTACKSDSKDAAADNSELQLNQQVTSSIAIEGEIDWYHFRAVEANRVLNVRCSSNTYRPDVDLMVTAYEEDGNGELVRIYGDHAMEESQVPADISMNIYIDEPKDLHFAVRDLMDDECSDNPYYLTLSYAAADEGNNNFAGATPLGVDSAEGCRTDAIDSIGDLDFFSFSVSQDGVYDISTQFNVHPGGTNVALTFDLYTSAGDRVGSLAQPQSSLYHIIPYLTAGDYILQVDEDGRNHFDVSSTYDVCVSAVSTDEAVSNDSVATAVAVIPASPSAGSLDYWEDADWYSFDPAAAGAGFQVINLDFSGTAPQNFIYQVSMMDQNGTLMSHDYHGSSGTYQSQVQSGTGTHYLLVSPAPGQILDGPAPYSVVVDITAIDDPDEIPGDDTMDNDSIAHAVILTAATPHLGKVAFRADIDYYSMVVPAAAEPQVFEVFFNADDPSTVEYAVSIIKDDVVKKVYDLDGSDGAALHTSILVPASAVPETYWIRVADYQNDDGADVQYSLSADVAAIPAAGAPSTTYYNEVTEQDGSSAPATIELVYNALTYSSFRVNTSHLDATSGPAATTLLSGTPYTFPTISGYIDYQGDQDWFAIPNQPLDAGHTDWYYDIQVQMQVGAGSGVEYVWRYYPDRPNSSGFQNGTVMERYNGGDGFIASGGDATVTTEPVDQLVPGAGDDPFWVGDPWEGRAYLSVSDFNILAGNPEPDDDWSGSLPYSLTVTLTYHAGCSYAEECGANP